MIKRELKSNLKSFIIWTLILIAIFLVVFLVYPFILTDDSVKNLDEMMKVFPPELLKAFNMDVTSINSVYGWLKSEGFMFILIIVGIYSSMLGSNILLKEERAYPACFVCPDLLPKILLVSSLLPGLYKYRVDLTLSPFVRV